MNMKLNDFVQKYLQILRSLFKASQKLSCIAPLIQKDSVHLLILKVTNRLQILHEHVAIIRRY